jgi:hypothetical protein
MFFFNGRIRTAHIVPVITRDRPSTYKVGHSCIIAGCLSIIIGLILILIGLISETEKTTFFGIGSISLGLGLFLTTLVCFYTQLNICYHNWAYGSHVTRSHIANSQPTAAGDISMSYCTGSTAMVQKVPAITPLSHPKSVKKLSNVEINKVIIAPSIKIGKTTTTNTDHVT